MHQSSSAPQTPSTALAGTARGGLAAVWRVLLELLFPPRCFGCGVRNTLLCRDCREAMPRLPADVCRRCAGVRPLGLQRTCRGCGRLSDALALVRAPYVYAGPARSAVHVLKFRAGPQVAPLLGGLMRASLAQRPLRAELVVPVPLAARRQRRRGYNQAALLAEQVAPSIGAPLAGDVLEREDRPAQVTLGAAERLENLRGSIRCRKPAGVRGRRVLVLDDVMTTGATLSACAEALAEAGAARVIGLVFARTL